MTRAMLVFVLFAVALVACIATFYYVNPAPLVFAVFAVAGLLAVVFGGSDEV